MIIGIFGGCFNPPHKMHEYIAKTLINIGYLDKVIFVPTGDYYPKANLVNSSKRYQMLKLMCKDKEYLEVSDYEINNESYTYKTLQHFNNKYPNDQIYFITGTDNLKQLNTWKNYKEILEKFHLVVIQRNSDNIEELKDKYIEYKDKITFVTLPNTQIASSIIRKEFAENRLENIRKYMDSNVLQYILNNNMYSIS